jgi:hypothetical protein
MSQILITSVVPGTEGRFLAQASEQTLLSLLELSQLNSTGSAAARRQFCDDEAGKWQIPSAT